MAEPSARNRRPYVIATVVTLIAVAAGLGWWFPLFDQLQHLSRWFTDHGVLGGGLFLALFSVWGLFLPKSPMVAFAGYTYGLHLGLAVTYLAASAAIIGAFILARSLGRRHAERWFRARPWLRACDRAIAEHGGKIVALMRLSPLVPFSIQNYLYGLSSVSLRTCLVASWIGMLPVMALCVSVGAVANGGASPMAGSAGWISVAGIVATGVAAVVVSRHARAALARCAGISDRS
jgi:uncharacterized membrane protein YdjX (TVP38/TMEM64 family)